MHRSKIELNVRRRRRFRRLCLWFRKILALYSTGLATSIMDRLSCFRNQWMQLTDTNLIYMESVYVIGNCLYIEMEIIRGPIYVLHVVIGCPNYIEIRNFNYLFKKESLPSSLHC